MVSELSIAQNEKAEFEEKYPLRLTWMSNEGGARWTYFLAPRIVND